MAEESPEPPGDLAAGGDPSLSRSGSFSRLNAAAAEFVPRPPAPHPHPHHHQPPRMVRIHHGPPPPPPMVHHVFHHPTSPPFLAPPPPPLSPGRGSYEYFGGGGRFVEQEAAQAQAQDPDPAQPGSGREGISDEVIHKINKQVEYYFSDINLATTEHLVRFISKDPEGYVPMSVIASFKKIKALVQNNCLLATALQKSSKLVVSEDGKKVRRHQPFTDSDLEELQSRIVVAENLPEDHCYQSLMKIFSAVGSVKTIRTCYPQAPNGTAVATNRSTKIDMLFGNRLHAFVEYETVEDAEKAVAELNDQRNWRSGLRVRLLHICMTKHGSGRGRRGPHEGDGNDEEDLSTCNEPIEKQMEVPLQQSEVSQLQECMGEENFIDMDGGVKRGRGRGRGRGGRGRGRGQYHNNRSNSGHVIGTPPSSHPIHMEQLPKHPPGPRMPDGTRGFAMGRGKPLSSDATA